MDLLKKRNDSVIYLYGYNEDGSFVTYNVDGMDDVLIDQIFWSSIFSDFMYGNYMYDKEIPIVRFLLTVVDLLKVKDKNETFNVDKYIDNLFKLSEYFLSAMKDRVVIINGREKFVKMLVFEKGYLNFR